VEKKSNREQGEKERGGGEVWWKIRGIENTMRGEEERRRRRGEEEEVEEKEKIGGKEV